MIESVAFELIDEDGDIWNIRLIRGFENGSIDQEHDFTAGLFAGVVFGKFT